MGMSVFSIPLAVRRMVGMSVRVRMRVRMRMRGSGSMLGLSYPLPRRGGGIGFSCRRGSRVLVVV